MKIKKIEIHNFRLIKDACFELNDYNLLIGENNSGKSTTITAIRTFYEDGGQKFIPGRDFPKFSTDDKESWVEIEYSLTDDENENLKEEYKLPNNRLRVHRYFQSENKELVSNQNSNIYGYENGKLSKNNFYGAKNISQAKLGRIIFIPKISKSSDTLKLSGPSPLRDITNFVFSRIVKTNPSYAALNTAFESFNKEFAPDLNILLFEEPEAFLHPTQQENLNIGLKRLSTSTQIIATTHSPVFVSRNTKELNSLFKLNRLKSESTVHFLTTEKIEDLLNENLGLVKFLEGEEIDENAKMYKESFRYFLWLDSERSSVFFSKHVIICEGATEKAFFDLLLDAKWTDLKEKQLYFLDCLGKYNIHRFMNIFEALGINHSVLFDGDNNAGIHEKINEFINSNKNPYTKGIKMFQDDFETFFGIYKPPNNRKDLKPLNLLLKYENGEIIDDKINELKNIILEIIETPTGNNGYT